MFNVDLMLQEDYKNFAENYLGIDFEDYVGLVHDIKLPKEEVDSDRELQYN
jgi:hypothetical protein